MSQPLKEERKREGEQGRTQCTGHSVQTGGHTEELSAEMKELGNWRIKFQIELVKMLESGERNV